MPDYSKLNLRYSNAGLNVEYTPAALDFGEWTVFKNAWTQYEGELTGRRGLGIVTNNAAPTPLIGMQQLNDWINNKFTYLYKGANGHFYWSTNGSHIANTVTPFNLEDTGVSPGSSSYGSFVIDRPPLSAAAWAYIGDANFNLKLSISSGSLLGQNMGMTRPLVATTPTFSTTGGGSLTASTTYYWRYTLYDKNTGVESLFNNDDNTSGLTTLTDGNLTGHIVIPSEAIDRACTNIRLYRKGGQLATWNRVSDDSATYNYTGTTITVNDGLSDLAIASSTVLDDISDKPFTITKPDGSVQAGYPLPYLFGPYLGYILGVGDPYNPGYLYWTNKFQPDMQNPANNIEVSSPQDPLQNGLVYNGLPYVFTKEALYGIYAGVSSQSTFTPSKTSCGRGLWAPHAFCVGPQIFFLSKDGIYATSGGLEQAMTDDKLRPIFDPLQSGTAINGIGIVDYTKTDYMFMVYYKQEVWFQYYGKDGNTNLLIYDVRYRRWRHVLGGGQGASVRCMFTDTQTPAIINFGGNDGNVYQEGGTTDGGTTIPTTITTGLITLGSPLIHKEFGALVMDLNPNGSTVTIRVYTNRGQNLIDLGSGYTIQTSSATRERLFVDLFSAFSEDLVIEISWTTTISPPVLYGYELFYRPDVPQMQKWAVTGITHGILGWQILRSAYITLISDGTVTLTVTSVLDGSTTTKSYLLASTGGTKRKYFIPFDPIKGKIFNYQLAVTSATNFRFYPQECEIHVKPWVSSFGYAAVNPFYGGGEQPGGFSGQQMPSRGGEGGAGGGGGGNSGADLAASIMPDFSFSGMGGGTPLGPIGSAPLQNYPQTGGPGSDLPNDYYAPGAGGKGIRGIQPGDPVPGGNPFEGPIPTGLPGSQYNG